jgi:hypothetical protein
MAYQVNKFNGVLQTTVADGTIDSTTDLRFVGKNYAGYGEVQNENFLHLMENFANTTAPPKVVVGQIWYDSGNKKLKFYDGVRFKVAGGAEVSTTQPSGLATGEFWWDSAAKQLYAWSGTQYVLVGPAASPELGSSSIATDTIKDNVTPVAGTHAIIKIIAGGEIVAIVNALEDFVPAFSTGLTADFPIVKQGITLRNTPTNGQTSTDYRFWGTASNADQLGGYDADQYVRTGISNPFTSAITFPDAGFYVGDDSDLRIWLENGEDVIIENVNNTNITVRISDGATNQNVAVFKNTGVYPGVDTTYDLGSVGLKWDAVYASSVIANILASDETTAYNGSTKRFTGSFIGSVLATDESTVLINAATKVIGYADASLKGNLVGTLTGDVSGTASNASTLNDLFPDSDATVETVAVRNSLGELNATRFNGTASSTEKVKINDSASDVAWNGADQSTWFRSAKTTKTAYSIAARNAAGNLLANVFDGTATSAQYADLAEKYLADKEYVPGTVVSICEHEGHEVEACQLGQRAIGVVSTNPGFMMNKDLEGGTYIALKGRVPCMVTGAVKKGQRLVAGPNGTAQVSLVGNADVFAMALESSDDAGVKSIEVLVL